MLDEGRRLPLPDPAALKKVSSRHIARAAVRDALLPLLLVLGASLFRLEALFLLPFVPFMLVVAIVSRRFHLYALAGGTLFVRAGVWRQRLWIVPVRNTQAVRFSRSPLQRLLGLATVAVDTAGAPALGGPRIVDLRLERARALMDEIAAGVRSRQSNDRGELHAS